MMVLSFQAVLPAAAANVSVGSHPAQTTTSPNILATSIIGHSTLQDLEIYDQSDAPINLSGWSFSFMLKGSDSCKAGITSPAIKFPAAWILSKNYLTFENQGTDSAADIFSVSPNFGVNCSNLWLSKVQIFRGNQTEQTVIIPGNTDLSAGHVARQHQRGNSPNSTRTMDGNFADDYAVSKITGSAGLYSDRLYAPPPSDKGLQILSILPSARNCSPSDNTSPDCADYVKLYNSNKADPNNSMKAAIDLSDYRLRIGYQGQSDSLTNTFHFNQMLGAGKYFTLATRDDGKALSITNSGGYVWLEDANGVKIYQPVIQYPSASSSKRVGEAWALDGATWRWTTAPHPFSANYFPPVEPTHANSSAPTNYVPCRADQYRNPATHRCRDIASGSSLRPCNPNQARNPATNRCRDISLASSSLKPCQAGDQRNPATNRCRKIGASTSQLKPCASDQTRNPATNRCRKTLAAAAGKIQDVKSPSSNSQTHWKIILLVGAIVAAAGYGFYEWRHEFALAREKLKAKIPGKRL
ncbi:MAG: hypothetical protein ACREGA_02535 [Candidatus Saccharimonadales bacterium]